MILRHTFTPHNNIRLTHLCGPADSHLRTIEAALQVSIAHRHEQFKVDGPKARATQALEVLQAVYELADRPITEEHLQLMLVGDSALAAETEGGPAPLNTRRADLRARTPTQATYLDNIATHDITFGIRPAGTGKTYLAVAQGVALLQTGRVDRLVLSRPAVEAGERLGFLPGDMKEKVDPYLRPLYDALHDMLPGEQVARRITAGEIEIAPLAFMRGRTLAHAYCILDEAQNTTPAQIKMFLTRMGEGSRMVITGDPTQVDLPAGQPSGLAEALRIVEGVEGIGVARFAERDVVRHPLVARIVAAYGRADDQSRAKKERYGTGK